MLFPEPNALQVLFAFQSYSRTSLLLAQSVAHHGYWVHRGFSRLVFELHRNNPVLVVDVLIGVLLAEGFVLLLDLLLRVEDQVEELGASQLHGRFGEVPPQDRQFLLGSGFVTGLQEVGVLRRDLQRGLETGSEVLDEDVLAEGSVAVGQLRRLIVLVGDFFELLGVEVDESGGSFLELPQAEGVCVRARLPTTMRLAGFIRLYQIINDCIQITFETSTRSRASGD